MSDTKTISLEDLARSDSFFSDLRNPNSVLLLGAGFSYGIDNNTRIKNRTDHPNPLYHNIPIASEFVEITNLEYGTNYAKNDFSNAITEWEKDLKANSSKKKLFRNLFLVDQAAFKKRFFDLYKSILIPNWYRIFTINFDDLFQAIFTMDDKDNHFKTLSYPHDCEFENIAKTQIAHVHGRITEESDVLDLVFFGTNYAHLHKSDNNLYFPLLNSINTGSQKKNLIIVGCKFNEIIQIQRFYHEIKLNGSNKPKVYQFDISEPIVSGGRDGIDYTFVKASTFNFLQFLNDNKSKIENISIAGAELIDSAFIERKTLIGSEDIYTKEGFYLAKQASDCQWIGIIKGWGVLRRGYDTIKSEVTDSFKIVNKNREPKIIARLIGRGGTGKSTLLRQLAIDLAKGVFAVIWVNNKQIDDFVDQGIKQFGHYPHKMFLVIIEDWYQIKKNRSEVINNLCNYSNIRIIIGDRDTDNSISREHFYEPEKNLFKLDVSIEENQETIDKILGNIKAWKPVANELLKSDKDYKSSLYLILWTIGRAYQLKSKTELTGKFSHGSLVGHFQSIVESDLRAIEKEFPGYAKAVYYWAMVYKTNKIYIGFDSFEKIANSFNGTGTDCSYALLPDELKRELEIYINKSIGDRKAAGSLPLIAFNHDILAEEGIASLQIARWSPFGDLIKIQMLNIIINDGDAYSASSFLYYFLQTANAGTITDHEKSEYVNALYRKGNRGSYLNHIFYSNKIFTSNERKQYAEEFLKEFISNEHFSPSTIASSIKEIGFTDNSGISEKQIIAHFIKGKEMDHSIISNCLTNLRELPGKGEKQAEDLISRYIKGKEMFHAIISNCLANLRETPGKGEKQAKKLISVYIKGKEMFHAIISNCLENLRQTPGRGEKQAKDLISRYIKGKEMGHAIISNCLENLRETPGKGEKQAKDLIGLYIKGKYIPHAIISNCLTNLRGTTDKGEKQARDLISRYFNGKEVHYAIISSCLENLRETPGKGEKEAKELIRLYIDNEKINGNPIAPEVISSCLTNLKETAEKGEISAKTLIDRYVNGEQIFGKIIYYGIICNCLQNLGKTANKGEIEAKKLIDRYIEGEKIYDGIISNCLKNLRDTTIGIKYAKSLLENKDWKNEKWSIVYQSLYCFSLLQHPPAFVINIVVTIINDRFNKKNTEQAKFFRYLNLMGIPFHQIPEWKEVTQDIIETFYEKSSRSLIVKVLYSYRSRPDEIRLACEYILKNWRTEIDIAIPQGRDKDPHFGDHIKTALGHPALTELAKTTSEEIIAEKSIRLRYYLFQIAEQIIKGTYKGWDLKHSDEDISEETE